VISKLVNLKYDIIWNRTFTHYYWKAQALSIPHGDSVWTPVCSSVILLSTCQCDPHRVNQNSAVHASTLYLYLIECQLFLQWSCWSVDFIYCFLSLTVRRTIYQMCVV